MNKQIITAYKKLSKDLQLNFIKRYYPKQYNILTSNIQEEHLSSDLLDEVMGYLSIHGDEL